MFEQELKLTAPNSEVLTSALHSDIIKNHALNFNPQPERFLAKYYDTSDRVLEKEQCCLRARLEGKVFRAAFKLRGQIIDGLSQRQEYECDINGWLKNAGMIPDGEVKFLVLNYIEENDRLHTVVNIDMQRQIVNLDIHGTSIEMVADYGLISANNKQVDLFEIELELISGDINNIIELGRKLQLKYDLVPSKITKFQIGLAHWKTP